MNRYSASSQVMRRIHPRTHPSDLVLHTGSERFGSGDKADGIFYQWDILLVLAGNVRWSTDAEEFEMSKGELLLMQPGIWNGWKVTEEQPFWQATWAVFQPRPHWQEWLGEIMEGKSVARFQIKDESVFVRLGRGLETAHRINTYGALHTQQWALLAIERVLLTLLAYHASQCEASDVRVQQAVRFAHAHFTEPLTIREMARAAHVSESYFSFLFARDLGMTPMAYVEKLRMARAGELLRQGALSVGEIAVALGYRNTSYFTRRFRLYHGQTPREFGKSKAVSP